MERKPGCSNYRSIRSCTGQPYHKESRRRLQRAVKAHNRENKGYVHDVSHTEIFRFDFDKEVTSENTNEMVVGLLEMRSGVELDLVAFVAVDVFGSLSHTCDSEDHENRNPGRQRVVRGNHGEQLQ